MATVAEVAKASLQKLLVQASEADLEPAEYQDFIFAMNNYMAALEAEGIDIGYSPVSDLGDELTVPDGAISGIVSLMAIEVAADYDRQVSPALATSAENGMRVILKLGQVVQRSSLPANLPLGSGHWQKRISKFR